MMDAAPSECQRVRICHASNLRLYASKLLRGQLHEEREEVIDMRIDPRPVLLVWSGTHETDEPCPEDKSGFTIAQGVEIGRDTEQVDAGVGAVPGGEELLGRGQTHLRRAEVLAEVIEGVGPRLLGHGGG